MLAGVSANAKRVEWVNDRGGSGVAQGTDSWNVSDCHLQPGLNNITATAINDHGQQEAKLAVTLDTSVVVPPPGSPQVTFLDQNQAGARFQATWTPSQGATSYSWTAGNNDGSFHVSGSTNNTSVPFTMPYGANADAFFCVTAQDAAGDQSEASCNGFTVPPKPLGPSAPTMTKRCAVTITAVPPDTAGGWQMQLFNYQVSISPQGKSTTRDVFIPAGPYSITARWTKQGVAAQTSVALVGECA